MTWTTLPTCTAVAVAAMSIPVGVMMRSGVGSERFGTADDLGDLLGDLRLTCTIICAPEHVQHLSGVVGCVLHCGAPRALLTRGGLDQRAVHHVSHIEWKQL